MDEPLDIEAGAREAFAEFLTSARRRSGRTLEDIARDTRVTPRYLDALEAGRIEALPAGLYRRSILRAYSTAIGLDPRVAMDWFERTFERQQTVQPSNEAPEPLQRRSRPTWLAPSLAAAGVAVVGLATVLSVRAMWSSSRLPSPAEPAADHSSIDRPQSLAVPVPAPAETALAQAPASAPVVRADSKAVARSAARGDAQRHRLIVRSSPEGARVTVNGIGWGVTPLTIPYLTPGEKVIRLTKDGYLGREQRVVLGDGGPASVRMTLRPSRRSLAGGAQPSAITRRTSSPVALPRVQP